MADKAAATAPNGAVPVVDKAGKVSYLPAALANDPAALEGLRRASDTELRGAQVQANQQATDEALRAQFSGSLGADVEGAVGPALAGAARGLTLGGSDEVLSDLGGSAVRRRLLDYQNYAPVASAVGEIGAIGGAALLGDEAGLGAIPNAIGRLGARAGAGVAEGLGGGMLARGAGVLARGAVEGAAFGAAPVVTEAALHDTDITGEALVGGVAHGAAGGMVANGLLHGAGSLVGKARGAFRPKAAAFEAIAEREFGEAAPGIGKKLASEPYRTMPPPAGEATAAPNAADRAGEAYLDATTSGTKRQEYGELWKNREVTINDSGERMQAHERDLAKAITEQQKAASVTDSATFGDSKVNHMAKLVSPSRFGEQSSVVQAWMADAQEAAATLSSDTLGGFGPTARKQFDEHMARLANALKSGDGHELYTAADNAKRWVGRQAQFGRGPHGLSEAGREFDRLYQGDAGLMQVLEHDAWGKAGAAQKAVNAATHQNISLGQRFRDGFTTEYGSKAGRPEYVADAPKISGFMGRLTKAANDTDAMAVRDMITTRRAFLDATEQSYDHGGQALQAIATERRALDAMEKTFDKSTKEASLINQFKRLQGEEQAQKIGGVFGLVTDTLSKPITTLQRLAQIEQHTKSVLEKVGVGTKKLVGGADMAAAKPAGLAPPKGAGKGFFSLLLDRAPTAAEHAAIVGATSGRKAWDRRVEAMAALQSNPAALTKRVGDALGPFASDAPKATTAATVTAMKGLRFLASKMPPSRRDEFTLQPQLQPASRASDSEVARHDRYQATLDNPTVVLDLAHKGALTPDHVEAVKAVYPKLYEQMRTDLFKELVNSKSELPYGRRIQLGILLDLPTDQTLAPDFVSAIQATYSASEKAGEEPPPPNLSRLDVAGSLQTATQSAALEGER